MKYDHGLDITISIGEKELANTMLCLFIYEDRYRRYQKPYLMFCQVVRHIF